MASLTKQKSKSLSAKQKRPVYWYAVLYLPPGHTVKADGYSRHTCNTTNLQTAKAVKARVERTLEQGLPYESEEREANWTELHRRFIAFKAGNTESEGTVKFYDKQLAAILVTYGQLTVEEWTRDSWIAYLADGIKGSAKWTRSYCQKQSTTLGQFVAWCIEEEDLKLDPMMAVNVLKTAGLKAGGYRKTKKRQKPCPTWAQFRQLATYLRDGITLPTMRKAGAGLALALLAGLRREEIRQLRWENIDLHSDAPSITLVGKTCERMIDIRPALHAILVQIEQADGWVCPHLNKLDPSSSNTCRNVALKHAGLPPLGWHAFRHAFCYWLFALGHDLDRVMEEMGHVNASTTSLYMTARWPEKRRMDADYFRKVFMEKGKLLQLTKAS